MEYESSEQDTESASGLNSAAVISSEETNTEQENKNELGDFIVDTVTACQAQPQTNGIAAQATEPKIEMASKENQISSNKTEPTKDDGEGLCNIKLDTLMLLKDSTKKLLCLIDELQVKSTSSRPIPSAYSADDLKIPILQELTLHLDDLPETSSIAKLENQIKEIDKAGLENVHECSIYERLIRKCNCLNRKEYNDFTIHFNEDTKYTTSNLGEIIKNIRILKKFLYIGGEYSKNALMFLNEGLTKCPHTEKVEIILACSHADICNVFDDDSFLKILIRCPIQYETVGDMMTQSLAARVLYRIAIIEEGRRYLNFNSKIPNDIKLILRNRSPCVKDDTKEFLNSTLNLLDPSAVPLINATYYCKADEGMANKILNSLQHYRRFMTLQEVFVNIDLLNKLCDNSKGLNDMRQNLKSTCILFKRLLLVYDNSEMNVIVTSIMNKLMQKPTIETNVFVNTPKTYVVSDTATEPTEMKHAVQQVPSLFTNFKKKVKSRLGIHVKTRHRSKSNKTVTKTKSPHGVGQSKTNNKSNISSNHISRKDSIEQSRTINKSNNNISKNISYKTVADTEQSKANINLSCTGELQKDKEQSKANSNLSRLLSGFCTGALQKDTEQSKVNSNLSRPLSAFCAGTLQKDTEQSKANSNLSRPLSGFGAGALQKDTEQSKANSNLPRPLSAFCAGALRKDTEQSKANSNLSRPLSGICARALQKELMSFVLTKEINLK